MSRWFRMYDEVLDDPKVQRLSGDDFKAWVNILCLASRNDGALPPASDIGFALRLDAKKTAAIINRLVAAGLIVAEGEALSPNKWNARQYKSDVSTGRVKRFRERSKPVSEALPETAPDTEPDTDSSVTKVTGAEAPPIDADKAFWDTAKSYLAPHVKGDPGSYIGKCCRDYGKAETARAITQAQIERAVSPIPFIAACLKGEKAKQPEYGPC